MNIQTLMQFSEFDTLHSLGEKRVSKSFKAQV